MLKFEIFKDVSNQYRWRLRANNYKIIATSGEGYHNRSDCEYAINLVKQNAASAEIN
ncbi:DUF1508 domain-containing protein [candidate division KSB1 bacterium]|nr:DUF1508 domain-containing protein [candidate division KSB1 bacterium]